MQLIKVQKVFDMTQKCRKKYDEKRLTNQKL